MKRVISFMIALAVLCVYPLTVSASLVKASENLDLELASIDDNKVDEVYALIERAGAIKSKLSRYSNTEQEINDSDYNALINELDFVKNKLNALGAVPEHDVLQNFKINSGESVKNTTRGILIDDFAGFEDMYGEAYDLWGIYQQVEASYGTYDTYEIVIQDAFGGNYLTSQLSQDEDNSFVQVLPSNDPNMLEIVGGAIMDVVIGGVCDKIDKAVSALPYGKFIVFGGKTISVLHDIGSELSAYEYVGDPAEDTYQVECTTYTTMRFIYVKQSGSDDWYHCHTVNTVNIDEYHVYNYTVYSTTSTGHQREHDTLEIDKFVTPDRYAYRLTDAITTYRQGAHLFGNISYEVIGDYTLEVEYEGDTWDLATIPTKLALDQWELFQ